MRGSLIRVYGIRAYSDATNILPVTLTALLLLAPAGSLIFGSYLFVEELVYDITRCRLSTDKSSLQHHSSLFKCAFSSPCPEISRVSVLNRVTRRRVYLSGTLLASGDLLSCLCTWSFVLCLSAPLYLPQPDLPPCLAQIASPHYSHSLTIAVYCCSTSSG